MGNTKLGLTFSTCISDMAQLFVDHGQSTSHKQLHVVVNPLAVGCDFVEAIPAGVTSTKTAMNSQC